jgi:signal transduction histidine kinase
MSTPGGLAAGLAFLPNWLNEARDNVAFEALMSGWVRTSGFRAAGMIWSDANQKLILTAKPDGVTREIQPPAEFADVFAALKSEATTLWSMPNSSGRLYTTFAPTGREAGLLWIERTGFENWSEADRNYLKLSARLIERSSALGTQLGVTLDPERLSQRLADVAVVAGRMAHDFDNVLTGIMGFSDLSLPLVQAGSQPAKFIAEISKAGQRGIVFTQQLHELSRSGQTKPQPGSLPAVVAKEETRLRAIAPAGVSMTSHFPPNLAPVAMDGSVIAVVVSHLMENAIEAMPTGGKVHLHAEVVELSTLDAKKYLGQVQPGTHVLLNITDTGPGIKPEIRARLFHEPFCTTKVRHRGLGLATVYRSLVAHRGGIRIESPNPPDTGTLVRIVLPVAVVRPTATVPQTASTTVTR